MTTSLSLLMLIQLASAVSTQQTQSIFRNKQKRLPDKASNIENVLSVENEDDHKLVPNVKYSKQLASKFRMELHNTPSPSYPYQDKVSYTLQSKRHSIGVTGWSNRKSINGPTSEIRHIVNARKHFTLRQLKPSENLQKNVNLGENGTLQLKQEKLFKKRDDMNDDIFSHKKISMYKTGLCSAVASCACTKIDKIHIKADCSKLDLEHIPKFNDDVRIVDLSRNLLRHVYNDSFPSEITHIYLAINKIHDIKRGAFQRYRNLQHLDISHNKYLTFEAMVNVTKGMDNTNIKVLKFSSIYCEYGKGTILKREHLENLRNTSLEEIYMGSNRIEVIEKDAIRNLPKTLRVLGISNNIFTFGTYWIDFFYLQNIRFFNGSYMSFRISPLVPVANPCIDRPTGVNYFSTNLVYLVQMTTRRLNITIYLPEFLEEIDFRESISKYDAVMNNFFFVAPSLTINHNQGNYQKQLHGKGIYGNATETVYLSDNYCTFISPEYFSNAVNMKELYLNKNYLGDYLSRKQSSNLFQFQQRLKIIDLSRNHIATITPDLFSSNSAIESLILADNILPHLPFEIGHMRNLKLLDLSNNRLKFLNDSIMRNLDVISKDHNVTIDLSGNDLLCTCESIRFLEWIKMHKNGKKIIIKNVGSYSCTFANSSEAVFHDIKYIITKLKFECSTKLGIITVCVVCVIIFMSTVIVAILYRYRWKIRYLYFTTKRALTNVQPPNHDKYRYTAFLSFADEDKSVPIEIILPYLENTGMKICCHTRDFTPGRTIADNIAEAIHESCYTVCIISNHYLKSYWCMYEFNLAKMESEYARGGRNVFVLILCHDLDSSIVPLNLMHVMQNQCYLELPHDDDKDSCMMFLQRLQNTLS